MVEMESGHTSFTAFYKDISFSKTDQQNTNKYARRIYFFMNELNI
jgi:hypothetical protein